MDNKGQELVNAARDGNLEEVKRLMLTPINDETTPREPYNAYLIYQGGVTEVEDFIRKVHK